MTIPCPAADWPAALEERGPPDDPALLLTGRVRLGGAELRLVAIRIDPTLRWSPDYRPDLPAAGYAADGLDAALEGVLEELGVLAEQLGEILGETADAVVMLTGQRYRIMVL
jgi:hypothetical protein